MLDFLKNIGPTELMILALILIIFFGGKAIASLAKTSGETVREIKKIKKELTSSILDDSKPSKS